MAAEPNSENFGACAGAVIFGYVITWSMSTFRTYVRCFSLLIDWHISIRSYKLLYEYIHDKIVYNTINCAGQIDKYLFVYF